MKRSLLDFVDSSPINELLLLRDEFEKRCRDRLWLVGKEFFSNGGTDLFQNHIIPLVSHADLKKFFNLALVCKRWLEWVSGISYMDVSLVKSCHTTQLITFFNKTTKIKMRFKHFENAVNTDRFTSLYILGGSSRSNYISIEKWTSLKELSICNIYNRYIEGWDSLIPTLTSLQCNACIFPLQKYLYLLVNLTHLCVNGFRNDLDISGNLTKLVYLESDYPGHFSSFSGRGILATPRTICGQWRYNDRNKFQAGYDFDHYYPNSYEIGVEGVWEKGKIISGEGVIGFHDDKGFRFIWRGNFVEGVPVGTIEDSYN